MAKVNDFAIIAELGLLVTTSSDKFLRIFKLEIRSEAEAKSIAEVGQIHLVSTTSFSKSSTQRGLQVEYDKKRHLLLVLSVDNQLEIFKINVSKPKTILKKMIRAEKKKALKRTHKEMEEAKGSDDESVQDDAAPIKRTVDKEAIQK